MREGGRDGGEDRDSIQGPQDVGRAQIYLLETMGTYLFRLSKGWVTELILHSN